MGSARTSTWRTSPSSDEHEAQNQPGEEAKRTRSQPQRRRGSSTPPHAISHGTFASDQGREGILVPFRSYGQVWTRQECERRHRSRPSVRRNDFRDTNTRKAIGFLEASWDRVPAVTHATNKRFVSLSHFRRRRS